MADYLVDIRSKFAWQQPVEDKDLITSPAASKGDRYIIAGIGSNWSGGTINDIAQYNGSTWDFYTPSEGWMCWVKDENIYYRFNGSNWVEEIDNFTLKHSNGQLKIADRIELNIMLNAFRIAINGSLTQFNMTDGISDEFEDESGVDTVNSTNESYDSTNDLYSPTSASAPVLLLHCNGSDASTTFIDDSPSSHTVTANGDAQLDTAEKKFGTASALFDGTNDYLTIPDSSDWDISTNWTLDLWIKHDLYDANEAYVVHWEDADNFWSLTQFIPGGIYFEITSGGGSILSFGGNYTISDTDWHHVAVCKVGNEYGIYVDGDQKSYVSDASMDTFAGSLYIAERGDGLYDFDGFMDEIRITHSNDFNASPNSGKTDTITVPTSEHSDSGAVQNMTLISESFTAESIPEDARLVIFEEDVDTPTLNTDIKGYVSRDGGSTWVQATLADEGDYASGKRILTGVVDLTQSGIGSGTSMEYKIETLNNKDLKLHCVGLLWD